MTPKSVLDAGKAERDSLKSSAISFRQGETRDWFVWVYGKRDRIQRLFTGSEVECQDFIDDRVFRAMLRAELAHLRAVWDSKHSDFDIFDEFVGQQLNRLAEDADG